MKLSTKFYISAYIIVILSIALANYLGKLNLGYIIGSIAWTTATILLVLRSELIKIEKKFKDSYPE
ncbi:hypothetical protein NRK67_12015 [Fusobacteria bacterium ZRK30]|nr:hypothetical protein NRK67_12015 [Fusobacteria bacterium ZRK30]